MLASSFLSAEELKIEPKWRDALIEVLHRLESGELRQFKYHETWGHAYQASYTGKVPPVMLFNMNNWSAPSECGTVHCIGGAAEEIGGFKFPRYDSGVLKLRSLNALFHPNTGEDWHTLPPDRAARTLRHFLETGQVCWQKKIRRTKKRIAA